MTEDGGRLRLRLEVACEEALEHLKRSEFQEAPGLLQPVIDELARNEHLALELGREVEVLIDRRWTVRRQEPAQGFGGD